MSKLHFVTMPILSRAVGRVTTELDQHGLWDEALESVDVYQIPIGDAYGYQAYGGSKDILIPAVSWCRLMDWLGNRYTSLADVLRHEYGHALADTHRGFFRSRRTLSMDPTSARQVEERIVMSSDSRFVRVTATSAMRRGHKVHSPKRHTAPTRMRNHEVLAGRV